MPIPDRKQMETQYAIFNRFMLQDQRSYYKSALERYDNAGAQVNRWRAIFSLLTGVASALAGVLVNSLSNNGVPNDTVHLIVSLLLIVAVVAPALGGAFGTLSDLFQWDRLMTIYKTAEENVIVAEALAPDLEMPDGEYWAALQAFTEGTLTVMRDETAQWGQLIRDPEQIRDFIEKARKRATQQMNAVPAVASELGSEPVAAPALAPAQLNYQPIAEQRRGLLDLDACAVFLELLLGILRSILANAFQDILRGAFHQVLCFFQAQVRQRAHGLDDVDLLGASVLKDNGELSLLLNGFGSGSSSATGGGHCHHRHGRSSLNAPTIFERFGQFDNFHHAQTAQSVNQFIHFSHC